MDSFSFKKIDYTDLPLLYRWYNLDHVQAWYAKGPLDYDELKSKFQRYMSHNPSRTIFGYICYYNKKPIGYIQYYSIKRHQWLDVDLSKFIENAAGIDIFIGESDQIGKGLGSKIIKRFLTRHVFRKFNFCFVDPHAENTAAISCYKKCGFEWYSKVFSDDKEVHQLLIKSKSSLKKLVNSKRDQTNSNNTGNKKNFIGNYIANTYFYWWNKSKNHSADARNTT